MKEFEKRAEQIISHMFGIHKLSVNSAECLKEQKRLIAIELKKYAMDCLHDSKLESELYDKI